jgi:archaellum component FlaG (FlaF/FlaG flagellin family)
MNIERQIAENRRKAISQSMDLFIIIAAVLAVGGIVTAAIYGLAGSATSNQSVQVTGVSLTAGASSTAGPAAFTITIKNSGTSTITCTATTCLVTFSGTSEGSTPATVTCAATTCLNSSPSGWVLTAAAAGAPLQFNYGTNTLAPGAATSFTLSSVTIGGTTTGVSMPTHGASQVLTVSFGTAAASITVTAS